MNLLTINVHSWLEDDQKKKMDILIDTILTQEYDVVALQEVNQRIEKRIIRNNEIKEDNYGLLLVNKLNKISENKYYYYWTNSHKGYGIFDEGLAFITKHKALKIDEFYCTENKSIDTISSRKVLSLDLMINNINVEFYCCHMNLPTCKNENYIENFKNILNRTNKNNLKIFMGDFNIDSTIHKNTYENIINLGINDTYYLAEKRDSGITVYDNISGWQDENKKRIDYIFINKDNFLVTYSKVIFNGKESPMISDHMGVEVEILI